MEQTTHSKFHLKKSGIGQLGRRTNKVIRRSKVVRGSDGFERVSNYFDTPSGNVASCSSVPNTESRSYSPVNSLTKTNKSKTLFSVSELIRLFSYTERFKSLRYV